MKLTKDSVTALALPAGKSEQFFWDDDLPGFGVRLRGGTKVWVVQYRAGGHQRRESLGDVRKVNLEDARKIARQRFAQVELGVDPAAERARARAEATATKLTLQSVSERYLAAKEDRLRSSTFKASKKYFAVHWKPLHGQPLDSIKRADVAARLQEIIKTHGRTSAARARGNLSALYSWAMREGLCETNPVTATNDPIEGIMPRERVLADDEFRMIWKACEEDDDFSRIVKLLLLTGCRREEIGGLKRSEVNFDTGVMTIPGTRTKNRRTLDLPLPEIALEILRSTPAHEGRDYFFGRFGGSFSGWSAGKLRIDAQVVLTSGKTIPAWTLHDLRRTCRTGMGKLGVPPHIAELVINHVKGGVEAIYDRHRYQREIAAALALWGDHVRSIVDGEAPKVVSLRSAG
jgi:integrase